MNYQLLPNSCCYQEMNLLLLVAQLVDGAATLFNTLSTALAG
jgi:hypothetical protein